MNEVFMELTAFKDIGAHPARTFETDGLRRYSNYGHGHAEENSVAECCSYMPEALTLVLVNFGVLNLAILNCGACLRSTNRCIDDALRRGDGWFRYLHRRKNLL
ncbi:MAG: hypothetical protein DMG75_01105 [Acidobacteria bacterium]|nr:MAG: hypothetical protein DMG75_01105 [Acidobacteriota bacterium]